MQGQINKNAPVIYKARVFYHHTDCKGVVYYANYLKFLEEARTDLLDKKGINLASYAKHGRYFVVSRQEIDYSAPARYGDVLEITTKVNGVSGARIDISCEIRNEASCLLATARTVLAFIDTSFKPRPISEELRGLLLT